eukprot:gene13518-biopygen1864
MKEMGWSIRPAQGRPSGHPGGLTGIERRRVPVGSSSVGARAAATLCRRRQPHSLGQQSSSGVAGGPHDLRGRAPSLTPAHGDAPRGRVLRRPAHSRPPFPLLRAAAERARIDAPPPLPHSRSLVDDRRRMRPCPLAAPLCAVDKLIRGSDGNCGDIAPCCRRRSRRTSL